MAGSPPPVDTPKLGIKATVAGLIFAAAVLAGFGVATASSYEDSFHHDDEYGDDHSEEDKSHEGDDDHDE